MTVTLNDEVAQRADAAARARARAAAAGMPPIKDHAIGEGRPVRMVVIGAGFSGIGACIYLPQHVKDIQLQVYDRAEDVGGVWQANRYMGAACDIPAHTYQYTFASNTQWSKFYAGGSEIQQYISRVVDHYDLRPLIKLRHEVVEARWVDKTGQWTLKVKDLATGEIIEDRADFVFYATGLLSNPIWPKIPGRESFKGIVHHSGHWDAAAEEAAGMDWSTKTVGVIGTGSSAIQIMPEMQKKAKKVVNFGRSSTWITPTFGDNTLQKLGVDTSKNSNHTFTPKEREAFKDPQAYLDFRLMVERDLGGVHFLTHRGSDEQKYVHASSIEGMKTKLASKPEIAKALIPEFSIGCRRITPGPGYLEALTQDNVEFITDDLECFTEKGLRTKSGKEYELDAIICATGFDSTSVPRFPIYGTGGVNLQDEWKDEARTYLSSTVPKMPNFFSVMGAQSVIGAGNLLIIAEAQAVYVAKVVAKLQRECYKSFVPKEDAVEDYLKYIDNYFTRTVFTTQCNSWYKAGTATGKIRTLYPGSSAHLVAALRHPRWEDYTYERADGYEHSMAWLGDGHVPAEYDPAFYFEELRSGHKEHVLFTD